MNTPLERLIVDIGGRFADLAVDDGTREFRDAQRLSYKDVDGPEALLRSYLKGRRGEQPRVAAMAVRGPVDGDWISMPEPVWSFSVEQTRRALGLDSLVVVNDFSALAMALPMLHRSDVRQVGGGEARARGVLGVLGAGTGLGVSGLIPSSDGWVPLSTEGGHASFSPRNDLEKAVMQEAENRFHHVSFERVVSGAGLELIYEVHMSGRARRGRKAPLESRVITEKALAGDVDCWVALNCFCEMLGSAAANLALTLGARGGVYIGGAIVRGIGPALDRSGFRTRFESHGRFSRYLAEIPTSVILNERATMLGVSAILETDLRRSGRLQSTEFLDFVRRMRDELSKAERSVADLVLARPRQVLSMPVKEIAREAKVSEPTVIRLCRTLGCLGLHDFKLRLAAGLASSAALGPQSGQTIRPEDAVDRGVQALEDTASALLNLRGRLQSEGLGAAIAELKAASRICLAGLGHYSHLAREFELRLIRLGYKTACFTDEWGLVAGALALGPGDVLLLMSNTGRVKTLLQSAQTARERGVPVIAVTTAGSPLAKLVDHALVAEHEEDVSQTIPMASRTLHLMLTDVLLIGLEGRYPLRLLELESNPD